MPEQHGQVVRIFINDYFQLHLIFIIVKEFEEPVKKLEIIVNNCVLTFMQVLLWIEAQLR